MSAVRAFLTLSLIGFLVPLLAGVATAQTGSESAQLSAIQKRLLSGAASFALDPISASSPPPPVLDKGPAARRLNPGHLPNYAPRGSEGCGPTIGSNVKVNQDCLSLTDADQSGRGQAQNQPAIAHDPRAPQHLVAAFNDYRRGDTTCGAAFSRDDGRTWNDSTLPNGFVRGAVFGNAARQYFQTGSVATVAWDTKGNAYLSCLAFMRGTPTTNTNDFSTGLYVFRSTGNAGASWNFPGRAVAERFDTTGNSLLDQPRMTVDTTSGSPFQDRVYVSWTDFGADGSTYIWAAHSADYGQRFGAPVLVSRDSPFCVNTFGAGTPQGHCNQNQAAQPFAGRDGALYVVWVNYNNAFTGSDNRNQVLLAKSTDGGVTFGSPVKVADYYDLPDCLTYQGLNAGRACLPEKGAGTSSFFRASNYASGAVDPTSASRVVVAFGSYINPSSSESRGCVPAGFAASGWPLYSGVKTPGACNNDILVSVSTDGGASFTGTTIDPRILTSVSSTPGQARTDQWSQGLAFAESGRLAISYYDRQYGDADTSGFADVSLSGSSDLVRFAVTRVTSSSMPPPTQFGGTFWGDYTGLTVTDVAHPFWSDTRFPALVLCPDTGRPGVPPSPCLAGASNASVANDQDVFTDRVAVPAP